MPYWVYVSTAIIAVVTVGGAVFAFGKWVGNVNADRSSFKDFIKEIRKDIKKILRLLPPAPVASSSPPHLTEYGEQLSRKLGAVEWAKSIAPTIQENVSGKAPFQVYDYCRGYVSQLSLETDPRLFEKAYQDGIIDEHVKNVLAIVLRDELLNRMEET